MLVFPAIFASHSVRFPLTFFEQNEDNFILNVHNLIKLKVSLRRLVQLEKNEWNLNLNFSIAFFSKHIFQVLKWITYDNLIEIEAKQSFWVVFVTILTPTVDFLLERVFGWTSIVSSLLALMSKFSSLVASFPAINFHYTIIVTFGILFYLNFVSLPFKCPDLPKINSFFSLPHTCSWLYAGNWGRFCL